jgi:hypothetical protein
MNYNYLKYKQKKNTHVKAFFQAVSEMQISKKQKIALTVVLLVGTCLFLFAAGGSQPIVSQNPLKDIRALLAWKDSNSTNHAAFDVMLGTFGWLDIIKSAIQYIVVAQNRAVTTVANSTFGDASMFSHITNGLMIFACIACAYKIAVHYLQTERHDNVKAFTGYFSYFGLLVLFLFAKPIVTHVVSLNQSINTSAINNIGNKIEAELDRTIENDYDALTLKLTKLDEDYKELTMFYNILPKAPLIISNRIDYYYSQFGDFYVGNIIKYLLFSILGIIITAVMAIPVFVMTFMVKVLLSVMIAGAQLVFLLSFIPGFENTWKTYMLNLLHVILWIPIFNAVIAFILTIISSVISDNSMQTGQLIWLCIVAVICSFQSVSLTTTAAGTIINGAGAGMAGAMGSLSSMNAMSVVGGAVSTVASVATSVVGAAAGVPPGATSAGASKKFSK